MNSDNNQSKNKNYIKNELHGTYLMLVYCVCHGECYLRQCTIEEKDFDNDNCLLTYKPPHTNYELANRCDYTDLYNMGIINFYENEDSSEVELRIIKDIRLDYDRFCNGTEFIHFYNKYKDTITDAYGNEIVYKNNNLAEWFEYIEANKVEYGPFLEEGEFFSG